MRITTYKTELNNDNLNILVKEKSCNCTGIETICSSREIFIKALLCGASGIVIAHNHPSGDTTPSKEDIESYNRLKEAVRVIGINVLDSVIVGDGHYSFVENGI